jgi:hypothetical protein
MRNRLTKRLKMISNKKNIKKQEKRSKNKQSNTLKKIKKTRKRTKRIRKTKIMNYKYGGMFGLQSLLGFLNIRAEPVAESEPSPPYKLAVICATPFTKESEKWKQYILNHQIIQDNVTYYGYEIDRTNIRDVDNGKIFDVVFDEFCPIAEERTTYYEIFCQNNLKIGGYLITIDDKFSKLTLEFQRLFEIKTDSDIQLIQRGGGGSPGQLNVYKRIG